MSDFFRTFAASKVIRTKKNAIMFGVKCSNQPISGRFAEEFVKNLLEARQHSHVSTQETDFEIVCE